MFDYEQCIKDRQPNVTLNTNQRTCLTSRLSHGDLKNLKWVSKDRTERTLLPNRKRGNLKNTCG